MANGIDAAKDVTSAIKSGTGSLGVTLSASLGVSKSKSTSATTDQTVVASAVSGGDVTIIATGAGAPSFDGAGLGTVKVTGSDVTATGNLTVLGAGPITFAAAQETDTTSGTSSSFGVSLGVSASVGLEQRKLNTGVPSVNFGISGSKGRFAGTDVTNREATLSAGGAATVIVRSGENASAGGTPGALTLDGAILSAKRVEIDAGALAIASRQDTSTFASKDKSAGVNISVTFAGQVSASGNLSSGKQSGDFASVQEQAGIRAGDGGFGIRVAGATDLKGAVIASTAEAAKNQLTTGTLTASDTLNRETFKASSTSIGAGIGANLGKDRKGTINTDQSGQPLPGIKTSIGTISATPPAALSASGSQSSTTVSAIAAGGITVTSSDTASLGVAQTISRDTSAANEALTKQFTEAKRTEIAQGFEATRQLVSEVGTFFANRGREEADLRTRADEAKARGDTSEETRLRAEAKKINDTFGSGSPIRIAATAFTAAAGSNVTGGLGSFAQAAAVNVIQSLAAAKVKDIADNIQGDRQTQETVRAALQAVVGCVGSVAGGNGGCGDAAIGAAASVVINNLITSASITPRDTNGDGVIDPLTSQEQQARVNIVTTLIAALASGAGLDAQIATTAATIETENNKTRNFRLANGAVARIADGPGEGLTVQQIIAKFGIDKHPDLSAISKAYGTRDADELQAIVNLIAAGKSATEIKQAQADATTAYGKGSTQAKAALVDLGSGRTTTAELSATARSSEPVITRNINLAAHLQAVKFNYDAVNGTGAYDALIAEGRAADAATQARVDAALAQVNREFACLILCPVGAALVPIAAGAAGTFAATTFGVSTATQVGVTAATGATLNVGLTFGQNALLGQRTTPGQVVGAAITGSVFVPGLTIIRSSATLNGVAIGGGSAFGGELFGQTVDLNTGFRSNFDIRQIGVNTLIGGAAGGITTRYVIDGGLNPPVIGRVSTRAGQISDGFAIQANELPRTVIGGVLQTQTQGVINATQCPTDQTKCLPVLLPRPQPTRQPRPVPVPAPRR